MNLQVIYYGGVTSCLCCLKYIALFFSVSGQLISDTVTNIRLVAFFDLLKHEENTTVLEHSVNINNYKHYSDAMNYSNDQKH